MNYNIQKFINRITFGLTEMGPGFNFNDIWYNFKYGVRNLRTFFWIIWKWRPFALSYSIQLWGKGLQVYLKESQSVRYIEIDETRLPKEAKMKRVIKLIDNLCKDTYIEQAEEVLGEMILHDIEFKPIEGKEKLFELVDKNTPEEKKHNSAIFALSTKIEEEEWKELFNTMKEDGKNWWN